MDAIAGLTTMYTSPGIIEQMYNQADIRTVAGAGGVNLPPNDEVERREVAPTANEVDLS